VADHLDPMLLQNMALRYAARDLNPGETADFESQLATVQEARDALSEAVRLSAAALGQTPPAPHYTLRAAIHDRLLGWYPAWLARRSYRGHPLAWAGLGAVAVAACTLIGLMQKEEEPTHSTPTAASAPSPSPESGTVGLAPEPRPQFSDEMLISHLSQDHTVTKSPAACDDEHAYKASVAEIWAELSTPDHVEKTHEEELRWRQKLREMGAFHPGKPSPTAAINDSREP
jgi:hypothetical protein